MAAPQKKGLDYFPLNVSLGEEFELIEAEYGLEGFAIVIKLYQKIYSENYFIEWSDRSCRLFASKLKVDESLCSEVIASAISEGIFDKELYSTYGILTSSGIQLRYFDACKRRKTVYYNLAYILCSQAELSEFKNLVDEASCKHDVNINSPESPTCIHDVNINEGNVNNNSINVDIYEQSKVKYSKVNKSKEEDDFSPEGEPADQSVLILPAEEEKKEKSCAKKERKEPEKLYPRFIASYDRFILDKTSVPAKLDGEQGKAAKSIIEYLKRASNDKSDDGVIASWEYILANWGRLEKFHQNRLKLSEISSNIVNIINQIKNGKTQANNSGSDKARKWHQHFASKS